MTLRVWGVGAGRRIHRLRGAEREGICRCIAGFRTEKGDRNERMLWLLGAGKGRNRFPPPEHSEGMQPCQHLNWGTSDF